jgi:peptidylprolyl isomerase
MKRKTAHIGLALAVGSMLLAACDSDGPAQPDFQVIEEVTFAPSLGIDLTAMTKTASGLYYQDLAEGTGDASTAGNTVEVAYTGYLNSGATFDSGSFSFVLASGQVVPGFDEGVTGMKVGGERRIIIPPQLGYGAAAVGSIPAGSILIFDVELLSIT